MEKDKPKYLISEKQNQSKFKAARKYAKKNGYDFNIWTEINLRKKIET